MAEDDLPPLTKVANKVDPTPEVCLVFIPDYRKGKRAKPFHDLVKDSQVFCTPVDGSGAATDPKRKVIFTQSGINPRVFTGWRPLMYCLTHSVFDLKQFLLLDRTKFKFEDKGRNATVTATTDMNNTPYFGHTKLHRDCRSSEDKGKRTHFGGNGKRRRPWHRARSLCGVVQRRFSQRLSAAQTEPWGA